ncbi:tetratricopeptide repeat protein [Lamprocystis purpurea]|uniref:tetratricopeptide repeat protein n=1 Tax=Lamprocystis purpurea TaxID=61598 RepID=UPI00037CFF55|nr:tetratricopeptide repeat protein [Lamprocystis purpurea]
MPAPAPAPKVAATPAPKPPKPSAPPPSPPPVAAAPAPKPAPAAANPAPASGLAPAADSLARQAEQQRQTGDYAGAAATLERSLRIAPRDPYLWNRLARVRMEQGQVSQAGQLATRSNDFAGKQPNVKQDNWRIIAESKRRAGDTAGATEAERKAGGN